MPPLVFPLEGEELEALAGILGEDDDLVASLAHGLDAHVLALALVLPIRVAEDLGGAEAALFVNLDRAGVARFGERVAADAADDGLGALGAVLDEALEEQRRRAVGEDNREHGVARSVVNLLDRGYFGNLAGFVGLVEVLDGLFERGEGKSFGVHSVNPCVVINWKLIYNFYFTKK